VPRTPAFIEDILPESPAARVGLKPDDLIVYLDGEQVPSVKALNEVLDRMPPGTEIQLEVRRSDRQTKAERLVTVRLKLEERVSKKN
jgi:serine protease Do